MSERRYYDAIDGLRAIAVTLVLFFHAGFGFAKGGFVGVDIFFVISGFLITKLIANSLDRGEWSFGGFFARRIARLTPALLVTILLTLAVSYFVLSPEDLAKLGRTGIYASVSASNIFFWLDSGYFDQSADTKPFLHTWSLGVEEQFYVIWPVLIVLLARLRDKVKMLFGLALVGALSLASAWLLHANHPDAVFYLMPFRIYQFAAGGLIGLLFSLRAGAIQSWAGFGSFAVMISIGYFASGESGPYWLNAIAPTVAAAVFIWSCEARAFKAVVASAPFVWVGRRSYSIYLAHWPIMVLWRTTTDFELSFVEGAAAIAASFLAGMILYGCIEKPFRFKAGSTQTQRARSLAFAFALFAGCLVASAHLWALDGFPNRLPVEFRKYADMKDEWAVRLDAVRVGKCNFTEDTPLATYDVAACASPPGGRRAYMIIGDSYAADAYLFLPSAYPQVYFGQLSLPGCPLNSPAKLNFAPARAWCADFYRLAFRIAQEKGFDGVVFASSWPVERKATMDELIQWAETNGLDAVFISDRPRFKERIPAIAASSMNRAQILQRAKSAEDHLYKTLAGSMIKNYASRTKIINIYDVMCDAQACPIFDDKGNLIYIDASHLTMAGASWIAPRIRSADPEIFDQ
ncbi:MAG: acyltransferase family protein [Parvularculaceae bacterium]